MSNQEHVVAEHVNSQRELISIQRVSSGEFAGRLVLIIHDDEPPRGSGRVAPMLLDEGTRRWLTEQMTALSTEDAA